ncbi:MAG TPA: DUF11 domain-containing protein [Chloroflexi bacterium]|nr:DUF11 domain-containing protein [Chloroflexota bacterium]
MQTQRILVPWVLGLGLALLTLALLGRTARSTTAAPTAELRVCPAGPPTCDYATVQAAVDAANDGAVIKVAAGVYTGVSARSGVTQVVYLSKTVTLQGGYTVTNWSAPDPGAYPTTLDAEGRGRALYVGWGVSPTIAGLRITGGDAAGQRGYAAYWPEEYDAGGGVYVGGAAALISRCVIYSNTAQWGGGVYLSGELAAIRESALLSNTAWNGGGLALAGAVTVEVSGNLIQGNVVQRGDSWVNGGGGVYLEHSLAALRGNVIRRNRAADQGGGVFILWSRFTVTLVNNVIADNQAQVGSGMWAGGSTVHLYHNTLARNTGGDGSGVYLTPSGPKLPFPFLAVMTNTVVVSQAAGISITTGGWTPPPHNTMIMDGVLWFETPITVSVEGGGVVTVENQYIGDPAFAADGYHLTARSAALDRGVDAGVAVDVDGEPRPGRGCDLGADEFPAALQVSKVAGADRVSPGSRLTYTLRVTNTGAADLHARITDTLPAGIAPGRTSGGTAFLPGGPITWTALVAAPGGVWEETVVVTAAESQTGPLVNRVEVTTEEGAAGGARVVVNHAQVYLPLVLRDYSAACTAHTAALVLSTRRMWCRWGISSPSRPG